MSSPRMIQQLRCTVNGQQYVAGIRVMGFIQRGIGIWPNQVTVRICERERQILPDDLYGLTFSILVGTDDRNAEISDWRLVDVTEVNHGTTSDNATNRAIEWDYTLEDGRWRLQNDRGGLLTQGVLNPTLPDGSINPGLRLENHELVNLCLAALPLTHREGALSSAVITKMDAIEPPAELVWRGAHAPTQLQRLLEWTRCAFCYNQNGTYSIHALKDPPDTPDSPYIPEIGKLPGGSHTITPPDHEGKCIIASCPTRHLIQRIRTLYQATPYEPPRPLQWVGVELDGSVQALTDLSWWPSGKTPLQVFQNKFADVADDYKRLAESCVYRMVRLHDDDLAEDWTLVERLVDQNFATSSPRGEPLGVLALSNASFQDKHGTWINPSTPVPVEGVRVDLDRGVVIFDRPQVRLNSRSQAPEQDAQELTGAQLAITFGHHPNAGDYTDYFMAAYKWDYDLEQVVKIADPDPPDPPHTAVYDALAEGVPVYRFPDLQLNYIEQAHPSTDIDVDNDTDIEALALGYAKALITAQQAKFEVQEYPGLHNVDPDHSTTLVLWDANNLMTTVHLGRHQPITADYLGRLIDSRSTHGGRVGSPAGGTGAGLARGASTAGGSLGPSTGARDATRIAANHVPPPPPVTRRRFFAQITGSTGPTNNTWTYDFTEVYKSNTGYGASAWTAPSGAITGTARNLFELINDATGANYLGIGITNNELDDTGGSPACPLDLRPVPDDVIVEIIVVDVFKGDGTVTYEYWFQWTNGVYEESA